MRIQINGEEKNFPENLKLSELVENLGLKSDRLAIELNREVVPRQRWSEIQVNEGDKLEIVHFVGGGDFDSCDSARRTQRNLDDSV
ncbi:MAG TPA: sulfur carrier protein ThiS [Terriglobales bacterium]|nr:sulfur carrier protein ThiS [Terriglobales bacterium]